jgi:hypothetical protein
MKTSAIEQFGQCGHRECALVGGEGSGFCRGVSKAQFMPRVHRAAAHPLLASRTRYRTHTPIVSLHRARLTQRRPAAAPAEGGDRRQRQPRAAAGLPAAAGGGWRRRPGHVAVLRCARRARRGAHRARPAAGGAGLCWRGRRPAFRALRAALAARGAAARDGGVAASVWGEARPRHGEYAGDAAAATVATDRAAPAAPLTNTSAKRAANGRWASSAQTRCWRAIGPRAVPFS